MKTLDKVIDAVENCYCLTEPIKGCDQCPYYGECNRDGDPYRDDVLHYLKEYWERKEVLRYWNEKAISEQQNIADAYMLYKAASEKKKDNLPLTWSELKQMEGKPVWFEYDNHLSGRKQIKYKVWDVIDLVEEDLVLVKGDYSYQKDEFGDIWQAYRKERK